MTCRFVRRPECSLCMTLNQGFRLRPARTAVRHCASTPVMAPGGVVSRVSRCCFTENSVPLGPAVTTRLIVVPPHVKRAARRVRGMRVVTTDQTSCGARAWTVLGAKGVRSSDVSPFLQCRAGWLGRLAEGRCWPEDGGWAVKALRRHGTPARW